jgi:light-regulated signal transduction histidine kinase (bacteriophytochrome)
MRGESVDETEMFIRNERVPAGLWISIQGRPLKDSRGETRGGVVVFQDVSERKRAEEQKRTLASRLEQSNRELQEFASVASHDLQEPLRKIQAFGDRLQARCGAALDEQGRDYLCRLQNAAGRMRILIDDLLTFSRVTSKGQPFLRVDLNAVAREVHSDLEARVQLSGGRVELGELPVIQADPLQMRQLLQNLIGNALKFHRPDVPPVVTIRGELLSSGNGCSGLCRLTVQDNGIGFDEKYLSRLFHVFQRLHGRGEYEGTGMGLAICRRIVERHGGSITAHSVPGQGAAFIVTLPVSPVGQAFQPDTQSGERAAESGWKA